MTTLQALRSAAELARLSKRHYPGESAEYRRVRTALLEKEIELRRQIERVAAQRRALPPILDLTHAGRGTDWYPELEYR